MGRALPAKASSAWERSRRARARASRRARRRSAPPPATAGNGASNIAACVPTLDPTTLRISFAAGLPKSTSTIPPFYAPTEAPCAPQLNDAPTIDGKTPKRGPWSLATIVLKSCARSRTASAESSAGALNSTARTRTRGAAPSSPRRRARVDEIAREQRSADGRRRRHPGARAGAIEEHSRLWRRGRRRGAEVSSSSQLLAQASTRAHEDVCGLATSASRVRARRERRRRGLRVRCSTIPRRRRRRHARSPSPLDAGRQARCLHSGSPDRVTGAAAAGGRRHQPAARAIGNLAVDAARGTTLAGRASEPLVRLLSHGTGAVRRESAAAPPTSL